MCQTFKYCFAEHTPAFKSLTSFMTDKYVLSLKANVAIISEINVKAHKNGEQIAVFVIIDKLFAKSPNHAQVGTFSSRRSGRHDTGN